MDALLIVLRGALKRKDQGPEIPIPDYVEKVTLGRNADCDVAINSLFVSGYHAQILRIQGEYFIEDVDSRSGTYVNYHQIPARTRVRLQNNDQIRMCKFLCSFHEVAPPADSLRAVPSAIRDGRIEWCCGCGQLMAVEFQQREVCFVRYALAENVEVATGGIFACCPECGCYFFLPCIAREPCVCQILTVSDK